MPNEDFTIKTGIEVDNGDVDQLEAIAKSLINIATLLEKFKTSKVNIDTSGLKNVQKEIDNTKNKINELKKLIGKNSKNGINKGTTDSLEKIANNTFSAIDPGIYDQINKSLDNAAIAAEKIKDALAGDTQSGLLVQINEMLSKTDELQNLADILKTNKNELDRLAKTSGVKKNKDAISTDAYNKNSLSWLNNGKNKLEKMYNGKAIGTSISQAENGVVRLTTSLKTAEGQWIKLSAKMDKSGNILKPKYTDVSDVNQIVKLEKSLTAVSSGEKVELSLDEIRSKETEVRAILKEVYGDAEKFDTRVNSLGEVSISKIFPDDDEVSNLKVQYDNVNEILEKWETSTNKIEDIQKMFSSASITTSKAIKKSTKTTSSSTSTKTPKYVTDQSYVSDYKTLADNEAFTKVLSTFKSQTDEAKKASEDRESILKRVNAQTPQNSVETNAKKKFDDLSESIETNITKYQNRIKSAYDTFNKIKVDKGGIAGIEDVFKSSEEQIDKWATAVAKGKMGIDEFEKKVSGLNGSVGSIGKIIDPAGITDAKGELESYLKELTGLQDISFSGFTEKNGLVSLKGTFKDSAGEAQTLTVQLNTLNGQIKNLGTSVKPVESGISKFFSGWKEKMVNLAQYLTSFQAMSQIWNAFKQGLEVVKEFDTALTEMRKVSDEPISKLKEFQKESFDMAKSVGTTALQIQNSTADFMRLGQGIEDAKQSSVNANRLLNVSEFDNISDATSALISMKAAYSDLSQERIIDSLNAVGV